MRTPHYFKKIVLVGMVLLLAVFNQRGFAADEENEKATGALLNAISQAKVSLADGIKQSTKGTEIPISAKYELDDKGKLSLSVYTADTKNNVFHEVSGSPEMAIWNPESEIIKDQTDLKDAQGQSSVLSKAKVSLADIAQKAAQKNIGTVISAIPQANHNDIEVKIAQNGKLNELHYDIANGNEVKMEGKDADEGKDNDGDKY